MSARCPDLDWRTTAKAGSPELIFFPHPLHLIQILFLPNFPLSFNTINLETTLIPSSPLLPQCSPPPPSASQPGSSDSSLIPHSSIPESVTVLSRKTQDLGPHRPGFKSVSATSCCLVAQLCPTLCDPVDCGPKSSSVLWILQASILEWVVNSFPRASSQPRNGTHVFCLAGRFFATEPPGKPQQSFNLRQIP